MIKRSLGKGELAKTFRPEVTEKTALRDLNDWLDRNKRLQAALLETGWNPEQRLYTIKQVELCWEYLGGPGSWEEIILQ